jgi:hypothetical protein
VEGNSTIPFEIKRIFFMRGMPADASRGAHAHRICYQFIILTNGGCDFILDNGKTRSQFRMDSSDTGILVPPMTWCVLMNFLPDTTCLVLASENYDEKDYIRDYMSFMEEVSA